MTYFYKKNLLDKNISNKLLKKNFFYKSQLENLKFENNKIYDSEFWKSQLHNVTFNNCTFKNVIFSELKIKKLIFNNCKFSNVEFSHLEFSRKTFINCIFKKILFNLVILGIDSGIPKSLINKNNKSIIFRLKNKKLIHKNYNFQLLKNQKIKKKLFFYGQNIRLLDEKKFKNIKKIPLPKIHKITKLNDFTKILINGSGIIKVNQKFNSNDIKYAEKFILRNCKKAKLNSFDKRNREKYLNDLFSKNKVFSKFLFNEKYKKETEKILGANFRSGLYSANVIKAGGKGQSFHFDYPYPLIKTESGKIKNFGYKFPINIQSVFFLTDINETNGPFCIIPFTQKFNFDPKFTELHISKDENTVCFEIDGKIFKYPIIYLTGKAGTMYMFNGLCWHRAGDNYSLNKVRITLNNQLIPNFISPMHKLKKNSYNEITKQLTGANLIYPMDKI